MNTPFKNCLEEATALVASQGADAAVAYVKTFLKDHSDMTRDFLTKKTPAEVETEMRTAVAEITEAMSPIKSQKPEAADAFVAQISALLKERYEAFKATQSQ